MTDAAERLVNLALYLAGSPRPVSAGDVREQVSGYPPGQDDAAFMRMFERDKEDLRAAGLALRVVGEGEEARYELDRDATYSAQVELTIEESAMLRVVAGALVRDPSFPFAEDLRFALAKLTPGVEAAEAPVVTALADEAPREQGRIVAALTRAATARKRVRFGYTTASGMSAGRDVDPYGLFLSEGRWYLVGRDLSREDVRTFAVARMHEMVVEAARPRTPDFEVPQDFDVRRYVMLPFQYGGRHVDAKLRFTPDTAWRAERLSAGQGELETRPDGSVVWRVQAAGADRLVRWVIENGPGIEVLGPAELTEALAEGLRKAVAAHG